MFLTHLSSQQSVLYGREFQDKLKMPRVKNTTSYVSNSSHTLSPAYTIERIIFSMGSLASIFLTKLGLIIYLQVR